MHYWLMKSEPDTYSIDDLAKAPKQIGHWEGVRNYQACNMLRDQMQRGDLAFYHSGCAARVVGIVEVVREGYPDFTAFDPESKYYDLKFVR
jgi:predicted RNA-binding protein with PUA-like domain